MKIPEKLNIIEYDNDLRNLIKDLKENECNSQIIEESNLHKDIKLSIFKSFLLFVQPQKEL